MSGASPGVEVLRAIGLDAERRAPEEACGVVLEHPGGRLEVRPLPNARDRFHTRDPLAWPGSNRTAFLIAPSDWIALERAAEAAGARIAWLYHSHPDGPDSPSAEDLAFAAPGGAPLTRDLGLLIVSLRGGKPLSCGVFCWGGEGDPQFVKKGSSGL